MSLIEQAEYYTPILDIPNQCFTDIDSKRELEKKYGRKNFICPCNNKQYNYLTTSAWLQHIKSNKHNIYRNQEERKYIMEFGNFTDPSETVQKTIKELREIKVINRQLINEKNLANSKIKSIENKNKNLNIQISNLNIQISNLKKLLKNNEKIENKTENKTGNEKKKKNIIIKDKEESSNSSSDVIIMY